MEQLKTKTLERITAIRITSPTSRNLLQNLFSLVTNTSFPLLLFDPKIFIELPVIFFRGVEPRGDSGSRLLEKQAAENPRKSRQAFPESAGVRKGLQVLPAVKGLCEGM